MPTHRIRRGAALLPGETGKADSSPIYVKSSTGLVQVVPGATGSTEKTLVDTDTAQTLAGKTIAGPASAASLITTKGVTAAESGSLFFLNLAAGFVTTLPAAALGLYYDFIVATAPTAGSYTIVCPGAATLFKGHVLTNDVNSATDSDFGTAGEATITIVVNKAVAGDRVHVSCDGTNWFVSAECSVFDAVTIS